MKYKKEERVKMADKKFGTRVKLRRQQLGLTQAQLAEKIGVRRRS